MLKKMHLPIFIFILALSACAQELPVISPPTTVTAIPSTPTASTAIQFTPTFSTPTPSSGIEGQVTEGPMCPGPVRIGDSKCQDQPYQASISILDANNIRVIQFQTDINGQFKIALPPGSYILHPLSGKSFPHAADQPVQVLPGQLTQINVVYDTGMR